MLIIDVIECNRRNTVLCMHGRCLVISTCNALGNLQRSRYGPQCGHIPLDIDMVTIEYVLSYCDNIIQIIIVFFFASKVFPVGLSLVRMQK